MLLIGSHLEHHLFHFETRFKYRVHTFEETYTSGAFNNYMNEKRWVGGQCPQLVTREQIVGLIKISTIVHLRGVGDQNWQEFGPRS